MVIAASTNGGVRVRTNEQGTPLEIAINRTELRRSPEDLSAEILRLCRESAVTAGLKRRAELEKQGVSETVLKALRLPEPPQAAPPAHTEPVTSWLMRG